MEVAGMTDTIVYRPARVANLLKSIVDKNCRDGVVYYGHIGEMPSLTDVLCTIRDLEESSPRCITIMDDEEGEA
jgi:hypothetical protein